MIVTINKSPSTSHLSKSYYQLLLVVSIVTINKSLLLTTTTSRHSTLKRVSYVRVLDDMLCLFYTTAEDSMMSRNLKHNKKRGGSCTSRSVLFPLVPWRRQKSTMKQNNQTNKKIKHGWPQVAAVSCFRHPIDAAINSTPLTCTRSRLLACLLACSDSQRVLGHPQELSCAI